MGASVSAKLWENYLVKYPSGQIQAAMFHNAVAPIVRATALQSGQIVLKKLLCPTSAL